MSGILIRRANMVCSSTPIDYSTVYLTLKALEAGTFTFTGTSTNSLSYSLDNGATWTALESGIASPTVNAGGRIMWKGACTSVTSGDNTGIGTFSSTGTFDVEGNAFSLKYGDEFAGKTDMGANYFYSALFRSSKVVNAKNLVLPSTLRNYCFSNMFRGCTNLVTAPQLPGLDLKTYSYSGMFRGCTSLVNAPQIPATVFGQYSCYGMFYGCTALVSSPDLLCTTLNTQSCDSMFYNCSALTKAPALPATTLAKACYQNMFYGCTSLVTAPELRAATVTQSGYLNMFKGCSKLKYVTCLATDISATSAVSSWLSGVASGGTFTKAASMESWSSGASGIPSSWTVVNA